MFLRVSKFHLVKLFPPPPCPVWCVPVQIENLKWRGPDLQIVREFDMKESRFADLLIENLKSRFWEKLSSETVLLICDDLFLLLSNIVTKSMSNTQLLTTVLPSPKAELHHSPSLSSPSSFLLFGSTWTKKQRVNPMFLQQLLIMHDPIICSKGTFDLMIDMAIGLLSLRMVPARFRWWCQVHFQGKSFLCQSHPGTGIVINVWSDDLCSLVHRLIVFDSLWLLGY